MVGLRFCKVLSVKTNNYEHACGGFVFVGGFLRWYIPMKYLFAHGSSTSNTKGISPEARCLAHRFFIYPAILEKLKKCYPAISQFWKFTRLQITRLVKFTRLHFTRLSWVLMKITRLRLPGWQFLPGWIVIYPAFQNFYPAIVYPAEKAG